jgi:hypothetical protein
MINKGIILCNDILDMIGIEYKKKRYWELSLNNRRGKEFWIKKFYFDQLFIKYLHRFDGVVRYEEYRPEVNIGNHYGNYISPEVYINKSISGELQKIVNMEQRYKLLNEIIILKDIPINCRRLAFKDKKHYMDVEEYIDCTQMLCVEVPYSEYKYNCFNGINCVSCNRIFNYTNDFLNIEDMDQFV